MIMKRTCSILLALLLLVSVAGTVWAGAAPQETEEAAESAVLMSDLDINAVPALPYNKLTTVECTEQEYSEYVRFTPAVSGAYTVYTSDPGETVVVSRWDSEAQTMRPFGSSARYFPDLGELRCIPMRAGETYVLEPWLSEGESIGLRVVSFADELKQAKAQGLPLLTGAAEGVEVSYTGEEDCYVARFVPAVTGGYMIRLNDDNVFQGLCGEEDVFFANRDSSFSADLIAGEEYLLYIHSASGAAVSGKLTVSLQPEDLKTYPLALTEEEIAAQLAAGPVRYTVLILDDDDEEGLEGNTAILENQKQVAMELCEALAAAPGTSYVAVVSMGWYQDTFDYESAALITDTTFSTGLTFTSDLETLRTAIDWLLGNCKKGCDIGKALNTADKLLDPVRAAYGAGAQTDIVLLTDGGNQYAQYMSRQYKGRYMGDTEGAEWANSAWCSACYTTARHVGANHPIYVANINSARGTVGFGGTFRPISEDTRAFLARFLEDLSTGDGRYFELYDVTVSQGTGEEYYSLKPSIGAKIAKAVLGETGSIKSDLWKIVPRLNGTELKFRTAADVPEGAKVLVAAYDGSGKLIRCLVTEADGYEKTLTVPKAADYKVFLLSKESVPLTEALTDFD